MDCKLTFDGFELGGKDDEASKLRLLDSDRFVGFGTPGIQQAVTPKLAGGAHLGRPVLEHRVFEARGLMARSWEVARNFAAAMAPGEQLLPLTYHGPAFTEPVRAYVSPQGVRIPVDALSTSLETIRLTGATWVAPDPVVYSDNATTGTVTATDQTFGTVPWTNPGIGQPPHGVGGHAWTLETTVTAGIVVSLTIIAAEQIDGQWTDLPWVRIPAVAPAGTRIVIGADRIPIAYIPGSTVPQPVVAETQIGGVWVPQPEWPRFRSGIPSRIGVTPTGIQNPAITTTITLRGTWL